MQSLQLDPPECELLAAKRASVAFVDGSLGGLDLFVESNLFDGAVLTMLNEITQRTLTG